MATAPQTIEALRVLSCHPYLYDLSYDKKRGSRGGEESVGVNEEIISEYQIATSQHIS